MSCERKVANALGGKTARACDSCLRKRARWFCAADDAFLCQACDTLVHSANQLASRHERVRLETSSYKAAVVENSPPSWHQGVTRKARTPRNGKPTMTQPHKDDNDKIENPILMVPEMGSEEGSLGENDEEQLLYQVPVFDPFDAELCNVQGDDDEFNALLNDDEGCDLNIPEIFTSDDMELADFAADVESLLGTAGLDDDQEANVLDVCFESGEVVKVELDEDEEVRDVIACHLDPALDMVRETLNDWDFDYGSSSMNVEDEDHEQKIMKGSASSVVDETTLMAMDDGSEVEVKKRKMILRLDYDAVIAAWDGQSSPWKDGIRPEFNPDGGWPDISGICMGENHHDMYGGHEHGGRLSDGGREARVSRYREKRRTRLFSKKIRYEVRKLNAEKRPRMKGRFVKRTSVIGQDFPYLIDK